MIFTQFHLPDGRRTEERIEVSKDAEKLAAVLMQRGFRFEAEVLRGGEVHLDCCDDERQLANVVRPNGPGMKEAVEKLVVEAYGVMTGRLR